MRDADPPTLDDVKRMIYALARKDRESLRPWILARFDVRGYALEGGVRIEPDEKEQPAPSRRD